MTHTTAAPIIILVRSQLPENVGMVARAMLNCELIELRLVAPQFDWPHERAEAASCNATAVLERVKVFDSVAAAVADLSFVLATTARERHMVKPIYSPTAAIEYALSRPPGERVGILFGPEKAGLLNEDLMLADAILTAPLNPQFSSLNLAQAVLLVAWEWRRLTVVSADKIQPTKGSPLATKESLHNFYTRLVAMLDESGFLRVQDKRPKMVRNIKNIFDRAQLTEQEVQTLFGMLRSIKDPGIKPRRKKHASARRRA